MQLQLKLNPRKVGIVLTCVALLLSGLSLIADYIVEVAYQDSDFAWLRLVDLFSVNLEESIPTWFATTLLFAASAILLVIALMQWQWGDHYRKHWGGLAVIFLYLSLDEGAVIHEVAADPLTEFFKTGGYLYFGWQILFVPLLLFFALVYLPFVMHLPPRTRNGFIAAGILYVGGAVVTEGISANELYLASDSYTYRYLAIATLEEFMEMLGVIVFISTLLDYIIIHEWQFSFISTDSQRKRSVTAEIPTPAREDRILDIIDRLRQYPHIHRIVLFAGGINMVFILWITVREATVINHLAELLLLLAAGIVVAGWVLGRALRPRVQNLPITRWGSWLLMAHLTLPVWFRLLVAGFDSLGLSFLSHWLLLPFSLILAAVFYTVWLPAMMPGTVKTRVSQSGGIVAGIILLMVFEQWGYYPVLILYMLVFLAILLMLDMSYTAWVSAALLAAVWVWFLPALNQWSNTFWFQHHDDLPADATTLFSDYSLRQKVDVLQDSSGNQYLYQNGVPYFDPVNGTWRNTLMGRLPASLIQPENALVMGAGSMQMELMIANYAGHVTTVEPDSLVAAVSQDLLTSYNFMDRLDNRTVVIDDSYSFLNQSEVHYDLIAIDLPDAYDLQTGALYTSPFFLLASEHLADRGVLVVNLTRPFTPDHLLSRRIGATLLAHFDDLLIVNSRDTSYAYASHDLPFTPEDVQQALEMTGETGFGIFETDAIRAIVAEAQPINDTGAWLWFYLDGTLSAH
jgi:hypothetical protein